MAEVVQPPEREERPRFLRRLKLGPISYYRALFWAYVTVALALFTFIAPPFQKSDEWAHYTRTVSLTNLDFICNAELDGRPAVMIKRKYAELHEIMHQDELAFNAQRKFNLDWLRTDFSDARFDEEIHSLVCGYPAAGYVPHALGVLLLKPLENPLPGFYLARIFGALFFVAAMVLALRVVPERYRLIIYCYAAIPIVLHQASAVSYDSVHLALFPLIFAYLAKFLDEERPIARSDLAMFLGAMWWNQSIRLFAYAPLMLLFFLIPWSKIAPTFKQYASLTAAFFAFTAITTALFALTYIPTTGDAAVAEIDAWAQVRFVLENPDEFLEAFLNTIDERGEEILTGTMAIFGWNRVPVIFIVYYALVFAGGIVLLQIVDRDRPLIDLRQQAILFGSALLTVAFLFGSLYVAWNEVGDDIILGLHGRYFVGLLPFLMFGASQLTLTVGKRRLATILLSFLAVFLLMTSSWSIYQRYYG